MLHRGRSLLIVGALVVLTFTLYHLGGSGRRSEEKGGGHTLQFSAEDRKRWSDLEGVISLIESGKEEEAIGQLLEKHQDAQQQVVDAAAKRMTGMLSSVGETIAKKPTLHDKIEFIKSVSVARNAVAAEMGKLLYVNFLFAQARSRLAARISMPVEVRSRSFSIVVQPAPTARR